MVHLTVRMGSKPILYIKWSISIDTMVSFYGHGDGHGDGDGTCKQALTERKWVCHRFGLVIQAIIIGTMLNFNGGHSGHGLRNVACKQTFHRGSNRHWLKNVTGKKTFTVPCLGVHLPDTNIWKHLKSTLYVTQVVLVCTCTDTGTQSHSSYILVVSTRTVWYFHTWWWVLILPGR